MSRLNLSIAMGDYYRTRALFDGRVQIDGVDPVYMLLSPEEMFFRAMRSRDFDISELSFSSYLVVGIRKELAAQHPWLPAAVQKAFSESTAAALELLSDTSATKDTLPFVEEQLKAARDVMGEDYWSYGVQNARRTLATFVRHHHAQGLSSRLVPAEELFHPVTYESYSI